MKNDIVFKKNPDIVTRKIDNETILVPVFKASKDMNCIYTLNTAASKVWELIDGKKSLGDIREMVLEKFDTTGEEADKEIARLLRDLKGIKALTEK